MQEKARARDDATTGQTHAWHTAYSPQKEGRQRGPEIPNRVDCCTDSFFLSRSRLDGSIAVRQVTTTPAGDESSVAGRSGVSSSPCTAAVASYAPREPGLSDCDDAG